MAVPVLIFGLGGTGGEVVDSFAKRISKRERKSDVKTIAIDTDRGELDSKVNIDERIALSEPGDIHMEQLAKETEWFPFDYWPRKGRHAAAGRMRPIPSFLVREVEKNRSTIRDRISKILARMRKEFTIDLMNIWIIGSPGGGSGSGMFCDVAEVIASIMDDHSFDYLINGILILPTGLGFENVEQIGRPNSYVCLNEIDFKNKEKNLFDAIFLMGLPIAEDVSTAFKSAKGMVSLILEAMLYGEISLQPGADLRDKSVMIDWTNFVRDVNTSAEAEKGGRYYTFGYSELRFDREKCIQYCKTRSEIEELKKKTEEEVQELAGVLNKRKEDIPERVDKIDAIFLDQAWKDRQTVFKENLHYQLLYFEDIFGKVDVELKKDEKEKESVEGEIKEMKEGLEKANSYIKEVKSSWRKVFKEYGKNIEEIGLNNLQTAKKDMEEWAKGLGFNIGLISTAKKAIGTIDNNIKEKEREKSSLEKRIKDLEDKEEFIRAKYVNELSKEIEEIRKEKEKKEEEIERTSLKEEKGYIKSYPIFKEIEMKKWEFLDKIYEIHKVKDISKLTLSEIIKEVETDKIVTDYARERVEKVDSEFARLKIPVGVKRQEHPFVWNIVACQDDDEVLGRVGLSDGSATGRIVHQLGKLKPDFHKTRWQFVKIVGGETLEALKELEDLREGYEEYPKKKELFCYPEVFESLEKT